MVHQLLMCGADVDGRSGSVGFALGEQVKEYVGSGCVVANLAGEEVHITCLMSGRGRLGNLSGNLAVS
ncbi:hypothetical protein NG895_07665 [Aeoliella sp. ICT_H6.2]|uniref:Uncharacterized protein n=1 Tax=Aeoliella straminimaris TaxID=2954799 RepID=A0A9X2JFJ5_9BACT|nr:hypothetical protein [Aeoliella straminimaris]MCO6043781.1 hypothetical protein [Aeoliella straminimaris]